MTVVDILCALMMAGTVGAPQVPPGNPGPGVPLALAQDRSARISNLRYELHFSVPDAQAEPVRGKAVLRFDLKDASKPLAVDFAGRSAVLRTPDGRASDVRLIDEHLVVPAAMLRDGENALTIDFESADGPLNRNPEFMYALFVPARARQAFPAFDQPDLKARYSLTLEIPASWRAISNGPERSTRTRGARRLIAFTETQPLPTYLFTFAAGMFKEEVAERNGRRLRFLHRETDDGKVARNRDAIFDLHAAALSWLERYTEIDYPFGKFEFLLVPSFQFGGMEHPGSIYYNASALLLDPSATQNQTLGRASLIAHETAHMWFGDLVTMRWFNDVWMKEVFANFMAAKIVNPAFPEINHDLRFLYSHYPAAYGVDRTEGTNAIRQPLANLTDAGSLYGAIIYQKAPIVMRQLEATLGADSLRDGLREYLKAHAFGTATWSDLIAILDRRTPEDLAAWSRAWVEEAGRPQITTELEIRDGRIARLAFRQRDAVEARGLTWSQRLHVILGYPSGPRVLQVPLQGARVDVPEAAGMPAPSYVLPTGGGVGYGGFILDPASRAWLLEHFSRIEDPLTRGATLVTLWEEMLDGRVPPAALADLLLSAAPAERDELNVERMLGYTAAVFWRFLNPEARDALAPRLERTLRAGLDAAGSRTLKSAWFNALRDTATSAETVAWLERIWAGTAEVPGLVLAEPDFITLAQEIALRGGPQAGKIIDAQIARTQNPDRKARMIFVRPSLSADGSERDRFFASLRDVEQRRREAWVLEAVGYLHHPLRAASAEKYVRPSLDLLLEIQRTGDIFFPKRWADATLVGHRSASVAATVRTFLESLPRDYPDRLRRVVRSAADDLFRIVRISQQ